MANLISRNNDLMDMRDGFFDNFFSNFMGNDNFQVDIKEKDNSYEVTADLPGFDKSDLNVTYDDGVLTIEATRNDVTEDKDEEGNFLHRERNSSSYRRQFMLKGIDDEKIDASFKDGVLNLNLPKAPGEDEDKKKIDIK
ncbi:Hsp20/alpha crystallin family protein [Tetragenococcus koreensis]|uniref:Hsp20/alpha crystallin family protein n=1 Tax=Tetragenococcus koreensis TaxID=290335 RepID=UPI000F50F2FD|nr:Hsp20/alpha crystallin family protein [Tetragenococcus koreensis]AYW46198.1 type III effector protein [Tetragenococcus koreensis]MCF1584939.1 Hsp20/alpha crystallin family protein [Tetragenococcus koreensis]MCF1614452.1 Hsp20/alpha crystallin family protein [Tetragenococcus koreensis]MCF1617238.1 Hsp20/alpha crystallin family protein [Tetragenococcus koreensis]MCF1619855.1 Hsp20/alpha crystallin family protein [Tetragenococcus koreensis]